MPHLPRTLAKLDALLLIPMADEPIHKRRRLHDGSSNAGQHDASTLSTPAIDLHASTACGFENMDPFLSPATASSWPFDEFAHDPDYLASQEALRSLMFTTARSAAPTRAGTPTEGDDFAGAMKIKHTLANGRRIQYLKNYMSQVAPWVSGNMYDFSDTNLRVCVLVAAFRT
jgi:hypothetical protein